MDAAATRREFWFDEIEMIAGSSGAATLGPDAVDIPATCVIGAGAAEELRLPEAAFAGSGAVAS